MNDLSEIAAELEKASKENDESTIERLHDTAMDKYDEVIKTIKSNLEIVDDPTPGGDDVLEFAPG